MAPAPESAPVLIIEDDPDLRDALGELLSGEGYEVATAADGAGRAPAARSTPAAVSRPAGPDAARHGRLRGSASSAGGSRAGGHPGDRLLRRRRRGAEGGAPRRGGVADEAARL